MDLKTSKIILMYSHIDYNNQIDNLLIIAYACLLRCTGRTVRAGTARNDLELFN